MAALEAARRVAARGVRRARRAVEDPRGLVAAGALAAGLAYYALYTESDSAECTLDEARRLDSDADGAKTQGEFETLMENWTKAAALYRKESCHEAKYKLGRLCFEGRGYVFDPELGFRLYESAAANGNRDAQFALAMAAYGLWTRRLQDAKSEADTLNESEMEMQQRNRIYLMSRCLSSASNAGCKKSASALAEIYSLDPYAPLRWAIGIIDFLRDAAKRSERAREQLFSLAEETTARPEQGQGGWRARVRAAEANGLSALLEYTLEHKRKGDAEPREMHVVAQLALRSRDSALHASARELRAEAARKGDIDATLALYEDTPKEQAATRESILNGGVRVGSSECLLARGKMYLEQGKTQQSERRPLARGGVWGLECSARVHAGVRGHAGQ